MIKYSNNAATTVASDINDSATTLTVVDASEFPTLGAGDELRITLSDVTNTLWEIVTCTAIVGTALTVVRAQENTSALAWGIGSDVSLRVTAGGMEAKADKTQVLTDVPSGALFTDTAYDSTAIDAAVALNTAKATNVDHPLVEKAVPANAVFTDTVYSHPANHSIAEVTGLQNALDNIDSLPTQSGNTGKFLTTDGSAASWAASGSVNGTSQRVVYTATAAQTSFAATYDVGFVDVYLNGIKLLVAIDFVATTGTAIVLSVGATVGDIVDIIAYGTFTLANHYTVTQVNSLFGYEIDGGVATSVYTGTQLIDGGAA